MFAILFCETHAVWCHMRKFSLQTTSTQPTVQMSGTIKHIGLWLKMFLGNESTNDQLVANLLQILISSLGAT
jgi:hypothetical protein